MTKKSEDNRGNAKAIAATSVSQAPPVRERTRPPEKTATPTEIVHAPPPGEIPAPRATFDAASKPGANTARDQVGYARPPEKHRFQKGRSGNPSGRPKGRLNLKTIVQREMQVLVLVREGGVEKRMTKQEAIVKKVMADAMAGKHQAVKSVLSFGEYQPDDDTATRPVAASDEAIIARFLLDRGPPADGIEIVEDADDADDAPDEI